MRIAECNRTGVSGIGNVAGAQEAGKSGGDAAGGAGGRDSGERMGLAGMLAGLSRAVALDRARRASQVQALARSYRSESYRLDGASTSRSMVSEALAGLDPG